MSAFPNVLAIDTAMSACNAGVFRAEGSKRVAKSERITGGHGERLMPMVMEVLKEAEIAFENLDAVVTTIGPGSFTGLRIGISAARALALALDIPVFGIATTQALAAQFAAERRVAKNIAVILETKREDLYFQAFAAGASVTVPARPLSAASIARIFAREEFIVIGDGVKRFQETPEAKGAAGAFEEYADLDAGFVARLFSVCPQDDIFWPEAAPLYLREADVSQPKAPQRMIRAK